MSSADLLRRNAPPPRRTPFQRFCAWTLSVSGAFFTLLALIPTDPKNDDGRMIVLVFGLLLLAIGLSWLWTIRKRSWMSHEDYADKAILEVAARHGGRATIAQITLETQLSMDDAERSINRLCGRNVAQPDLLDDGSVVYTFGMLGS